MNRSELGRQGEDAAAVFLKAQGLEIIELNFRIRGGEIDIVARDEFTLCFIEVKTRRSRTYGAPQESVSFFKKDRLIKAGLFYISGKNLHDQNVRFDVIFVFYKRGQKEPEMDWIKNAFEV